MVQPLVSVVIPAYNSEAWIRETLQSALAQTYAPVEIIVVDDASTDATGSLLQKFPGALRLFRNETNRGISASRNRGIQEARGSYIALLDHDDLWAPDKLEKQMRLFAQNPALGLVFSDCLCLTSEGKRWRYFQENPPVRERMFERLLDEDFIACPTIVIRKDLLAQVGLFNEDLRYAEEFDLILRIAQVAPLDYCDEVLATYRLHASNFSRGKLRTNLERVLMLSRYANQVPHVNGELIVRHLLLSLLYLKERHWKEAAGYASVGLLHALVHPLKVFRTLRTMQYRRRRRLTLMGSTA